VPIGRHPPTRRAHHVLPRFSHADAHPSRAPVAAPGRHHPSPARPVDRRRRATAYGRCAPAIRRRRYAGTGGRRRSYPERLQRPDRCRGTCHADAATLRGRRRGDGHRQRSPRHRPAVGLADRQRVGQEPGETGGARGGASQGGRQGDRRRDGAAEGGTVRPGPVAAVQRCAVGSRPAEKRLLEPFCAGAGQRQDGGRRPARRYSARRHVLGHVAGRRAADRQRHGYRHHPCAGSPTRPGGRRCCVDRRRHTRHTHRCRPR